MCRRCDNQFVWQAFGRLAVYVAILLLVSFFVHSAMAADYAREGGTADWMCCTDKDCTTIISQHADSVRAFKACEKLTDADGKTRYTRSNAFRITGAAPVTPPTTGSATVSWVPPISNTDGTDLTDLAGFKILYGASESDLTNTIDVAPSVTTYVVENLSKGTWYFAVKASNQDGTLSALSNVASKTI